MNVPLLVAGALAVGTGIIHIYLGERIFRLLRPNDLPNTRLGSGAATKSLLRGISALWGVSWLSAAALFFIFADDTLGGDAETTVRILASTFALYAIVILIRFGVRHPGGFAFAAIAIAAWGAHCDSQTSSQKLPGQQGASMLMETEVVQLAAPR